MEFGKFNEMKNKVRYDKWEAILNKLDYMGIKYEHYFDDEIFGYYEDVCEELVKDDEGDLFGLFVDDNGSYGICYGEELKEINYRYREDKIIKIMFDERDKLNN